MQQIHMQSIITLTYLNLSRKSDRKRVLSQNVSCGRPRSDLRMHWEILGGRVQGPLRPHPKASKWPTQQKQRGVYKLRNIIATNDH